MPSVPFDCWVVFPSKDAMHFVYPFPCWWILGCFQCEAVMNAVTMNSLAQFFIAGLLGIFQGPFQTRLQNKERQGTVSGTWQFRVIHILPKKQKLHCDFSPQWVEEHQYTRTDLGSLSHQAVCSPSWARISYPSQQNGCWPSFRSAQNIWFTSAELLLCAKLMGSLGDMGRQRWIWWAYVFEVLTV